MFYNATWVLDIDSKQIYNIDVPPKWSIYFLCTWTRKGNMQLKLPASGAGATAAPQREYGIFGIAFLCGICDDYDSGVSGGVSPVDVFGQNG